MLNFNDLIVSFEQLGLQDKPVIVHASLRAFGHVDGGPDAVVTALLYAFGGVMMPTHTYKTMVTPEGGPANNAINYSRREWNRMAVPYTGDMPADKLMGSVAENLRQRPEAKRSMHPILSFAGVNVDDAIARQTLEHPFAPILSLADQEGWVLLMGVDHTVNTSIHLAERLAKRKQFTRWAMLEDGKTAECPGFPGDSSGFQVIEPDLRPYTKTIRAGEASVQAIPLRMLIAKTMDRIKKDPLALLCQQVECERCMAVREHVRQHV